ncbi:MAG: hypothetical protein E7551_02245 [Ruminococcaceae bacterium]|nr:hypothetical protein [Oscillospiraceae bacterium]
MLYPKNKSEKISTELFKNPTSEYRCTPFWAWNCDLKKEELFKEIDFMKEMGMGGFHMHTRVGMSTTYLSDEYMEFIRACTEKAKNDNMLAWLYDEDKWPSGFAGGYVTKNPKHRQKFIIFTPEPYAEASVCGAESDDASAKIDGKQGNGVLLAKYDVELDEDGYLKSYKRIEENQKGEHNEWYAYLESANNGPWFNFQSYVDTLSKEAIDEFINVTHERYKQVVGEHFGSTVPAIFTDEPQVTHKGKLNFGHEKKDITLPFTTDFDDTYKAEYGESILDKLPEVIWNKRGIVSVTRYRYHDHATERFTSAFSDNIGAWCRKNNIMLTGHMMEEPTLSSQTAAIGEAMRAYRGFDLPGIDMLCDNREFSTAKQAVSATHQFGYEGAMSELYGVTNWDFDFKGHKTQGDWQAALGISVRVPHLYWVSMKGEAKRDYPASIGHQSSWYKEYSFIEDHFARVNTLMTRGTADIKIGVIHPVESYWINFGPNDQSGEVCGELEERFKQITHWLLFNTLDFDFISESLLPEQFTGTDNGFGVGKMNYDVVIVPALQTIRGTTLNALKEFAEKGGRVIFMGEAPTLVDAVPSNAATKLAEQCQKIGWSKNALLSTLEENRDIEIRKANGHLSDNLFYAMRNDGEGKNLFICHVGAPCRIRPPMGEQYRIKIKGIYKPTLYNTLTGEIFDYPATYTDTHTVLEWECYSEDSILLRLELGKSTASKASQTLSLGEEYMQGEAELILHEPNVCVIDMARWKIDDGEWKAKEEMLKIEVAAKKELGMSVAASQGAQPWVFKADEPVNTVTLEMSVDSEIELDNVQLALEDANISTVWWNGKQIDIKPQGYYVDFSITKINIGKLLKGANILTVKLPFNVVSNIENYFLLGDFGVEVKGSKVKIIEKPKVINFGDWVNQGIPFYGGALTYRTKIEGGAKTKVSLDIISAPCITVSLDGKVVSNISLAPHTADLGQLEKGEHTLDFNVYASRVNTFGAFHWTDRVAAWYGPTAWRTKGKEWSYEYRLRESGIITSPRIIKE